MIRFAVLLVLAAACSSGSESAAPSEPPEPTGREPEGAPEGPTEGATPEAPAEPAEPEAERRTYPTAEEGAAMLEPAIGQWVRYGVTWRNRGRSTTEYRFVDRQNDSWWLEVTDRRASGSNQVRMRVRPTDAGVELLALSFHRQGQPREDISERLLGTYQPMLAQWLEMIFPGPLAGEPEAVTVPAGVFPGARKTEKDLEFGGREIAAAVWRHPAIPVTGMARFADTEGGHTVELLAFGLEGARSAF